MMHMFQMNIPCSNKYILQVHTCHRHSVTNMIGLCIHRLTQAYTETTQWSCGIESLHMHTICGLWHHAVWQIIMNHQSHTASSTMKASYLLQC